MSAQEEVLTRGGLFELLCEMLLLETADVSEQTVLADLGPVWDSVAMVNVLVSLESQTGRAITMYDLAGTERLGDILDLALGSS